MSVNIKARSIMQSDVVTIAPRESLSDAARRMDLHRVSCLPVINDTGRLIGILSKTDLVHERIRPAGKSVVGAEDVMSPSPIVARPEESVCEVASKMLANGIHHIVVVDEDDRPIGIISALDLARPLIQVHDVLCKITEAQ